MSVTAIVISLVVILCSIALYIYISFSKRVNIKLKRNKLINDPKAFTYANIIKGLGGLENISYLEDKKIFVFSTSLVNKVYLKSLGLSVENTNEYFILNMKNFNMQNFYKKLENQLKKNKD
ncbi:hypothetical protein SHELI_v1c02110 [Spiroplasma helicoides]|uniref:PTS EIIB type-1 domain-containing protein n=1 Tax=Spiroplasma helicoides TaxID=216938 RepID=A0A1B3SJQ8_9MOLU|nr:hypothetical protein [Spiroplasma helicoides]AOG60166.1 hypothetical protein SHELI_v1c02110 [Spiroplasma helicoides]